MSPTKIITYSYPESPYAFKMHSIISLCGIKEYRNVRVSRIMPRPELASIGVNYRRIPILASGKDVYCDSQAIIDFLLSSTGIDTSAILGNTQADYGLKVLGDQIFRTAMQCIPPQALKPEFVADRRPIFKLLDNPEVEAGTLRPHGLGELRSLLLRIQRTALKDVTAFICGEKPTLSDAHLAWSIRWALMQIGVGREPGFGKEDLPIIWAWLERFVAATEFAPDEISGEEAAKEILGAAVRDLGAVEGDDPTGLEVGESVAVNQTDGDPTHPTEGKLVFLGQDEVVVEVKSGVRVHLPRIGQRITKSSSHL